MAGGNYRKPSLMSILMGLNGATVGTRINVCHFFGLIPFPVEVNFFDIRLSFEMQISNLMRVNLASSVPMSKNTSKIDKNY